MTQVRKTVMVSGQEVIDKLKKHLIAVSDEEKNKILQLSQKKLNRLMLLTRKLNQHNLLDQESFQKTLELVALKLPAVNESKHTKENLEKGKKVTIDSGVTIFFRDKKNYNSDLAGYYGRVTKGYAHPDDTEPTWAVKKLFSTKSPAVINEARREVKYLRQAGANAFFYTTKYAVKIVMDWQKGETLEQLTSSKEFASYSFARKLKILISIFSELMRLNNILRVHDDARDENIIVKDDKAVLIDYGKAKKTWNLSGEFNDDNYKVQTCTTRQEYNPFFASEWKDLRKVEGMAVKLLDDAMRTCTIAQAYEYCQMLFDNLDSLNHVKLQEIANATINRSNLTVDDVLHGSERPLMFARK